MTDIGTNGRGRHQRGLGRRLFLTIVAAATAAVAVKWAAAGEPWTSGDAFAFRDAAAIVIAFAALLVLARTILSGSAK